MYAIRAHARGNRDQRPKPRAAMCAYARGNENPIAMLWQISQRMSRPNEVVLYHPDFEHRLVLTVDPRYIDAVAQDNLSGLPVRAIYPCRTCGWDQTCEEGCHS